MSSRGVSVLASAAAAAFTDPHRDDIRTLVFRLEPLELSGLCCGTTSDNEEHNSRLSCRLAARLYLFPLFPFSACGSCETDAEPRLLLEFLECLHHMIGWGLSDNGKGKDIKGLGFRG